jgi:hypothetical protein
MEKLQKLFELFKKHLGSKLFYFKIEVAIEAGDIVNIKVTENIKL